MNEPVITTLPLTALKPSSTNPRRVLDEAALDELANSIRQNGVIQPLVVRPLNGGTTYEIMAGSRRFAAAKAAGLTEVPVRVREASDQEAAEIALIENLQRKDLDPVDEAEGFSALVQRGVPPDEIAARVGKSPSYVWQRLRLRHLVAAATKAYRDGQLQVGHLLLLARLEPDQQKQALDFALDRWRGTLGVGELKAYIVRDVYLDLAKAPWPLKDGTLVPTAGPCATCPKRTGFNRALFPDVEKGDTCTDPTCFQGKVDAFVVRTKEALQKDTGKPPLLLSDTYGRAPKGALSRQAWDEAKPKSCPHVQRGVYIDGSRAGTTLTVCATDACRVHRPGAARSGPSAGERAARQRTQAKHVLRLQLFDGVLAKTSALATADLKLVATAFFGDVWHEYRKLLLKRLGWYPEQKKGSVDVGAAFRAGIAKADAPTVARALMGLALVKQIDRRWEASSSPDVLAQLARAHRVRVPAPKPTRALALKAAKRK